MPVACFYMPQIGIACERARLPALWGEPVALAGADTIVVASDEAARFGIRAGQSITGGRALCRELIVLPYDRAAYEEAVQCIWNLLALESSIVEPVCPETCFMEMSGPGSVEGVRELACQIAVRTRISIQVGLAKSRLVAQTAAQKAEAAQVLTVEIGREAAVVAGLSLHQIPGLDRKLVQRLERLGVQTLGDVLRLPPSELNRQCKQMGLLLHRLALGEDGERVRALWPPRTLERAWRFEEEVVQLPAVEAAVKRCAYGIARSLREGREFARSLNLSIELADRTQAEAAERLAMPLDESDSLYRVALRLLRRLRIDQPVVEICLRAGDLGAGSGLQLTLLDEHGNGLPYERRQRLDATLTYLQRRYGFGVVVTAALLHQARRINLWTHSLARLAGESVEVVTTGQGIPARFYRRGERYQVAAVQNRWKETDWFWEGVVEKTAYRILTDPSGLYELHQYGVQWRLGGVAD